MVVTLKRHRRRLAAALTGLALAVSTAHAQTPAIPTSLAEAWLAVLQAENTSVTWSHSVALRQATAVRLPAQRARLVEELNTLVISARVAGNAPLAAALADWAEALKEDDPLMARTPGRFDLPWLGANLRHDPPLDTLAHWGLCEVPSWLEVWTLAGVERLPWQPGLDLTALVGGLPAAATQRADHAVVIDPIGGVSRLGIAAWNQESTVLAPGSRVMVQLPGAQGLRGALPGASLFPGASFFPGTDVESGLINERLPEYLATRLPGEACELRAGPPVQDSTAGSPGSPGN